MLKRTQTLASLRTSDRYCIFLGGAFTEAAATKNEIKKYQGVFTALLTNEIQQRQLIAAIEWLCGAKYPQLLKFFPVFLKQIFDEDLIEEDLFFQWDSDMTPNDYSVDRSFVSVAVLEQLKQSAKPFLVWLDEAEEEDDESEDEDA